MAYERLPKNTPAILRSYGLKVVVIPGWRLRGRPASTGNLNPVGVLCHHTATSIRSLLAAVLKLLIGGRSDLPGPLCNFGLGRDGTVYVIASGRANHAGKARSSGTVAAGDGNELYWGIEAFNDGLGEPWPAVQYKAYVLLCAVLSVRFTKNSVNTVRGHKETSVTGKIDPRFDMDEFRSKIALKMVEISTTAVPERTPRFRWTRGAKVDHALEDLQKTKARPKSERARQLQAAIAALKLVPAAKVNDTSDVEE